LGKLKWEPNKQWRGIFIQVAETEQHFFYKYEGKIFVQSKTGPINERIPYCYACGTEAKVVERTVPIWDGPFPCSGSGRVESYFAFYCSTCDPQPSSGTIRDIKINK